MNKGCQTVLRLSFLLGLARRWSCLSCDQDMLVASWSVLPMPSVFFFDLKNVCGPQTLVGHATAANK